MTGPVRIISDLHLGHRISRVEHAESLRPLLAGAGTVVFNGDTWQELAKELRERSAELLERLREICREEGCEPVFLPGNHDPGWAGEGYLELEDGKVVVTHGDALLRDGSPWKREILTHEDRIEEIWKNHPAADHDAGERHAVAREIAVSLPSLAHSKGRKIWQRAYDAVTPPQRAIEMLKAWSGQRAAGAAFCDRYFPEAEFLLVGHFHWGGCWDIGGRKMINTGSFLNPSRAYWVEIENGSLSWGRVDEHQREIRKGSVLGRWLLGR